MVDILCEGERFVSEQDGAEDEADILVGQPIYVGVKK